MVSQKAYQVECTGAAVMSIVIFLTVIADNFTVVDTFEIMPVYVSFGFPPLLPTGPQITVTGAISSNDDSISLSTYNASMSIVPCFCPAADTAGQPLLTPEGSRTYSLITLTLSLTL